MIYPENINLYLINLSSLGILTSPYERLDYDRRQESLRRDASVYESTYIAGRNETKIEIAKNLIEQNVDIDIVKLSTGLTDAELANLIK